MNQILRIANPTEPFDSGNTMQPTKTDLPLPDIAGTGQPTPGVTLATDPMGNVATNPPADLPLPKDYVPPGFDAATFQNADGQKIEERRQQEIDELAAHFAQVELDAAAAAADQAGKGELINADAPAEAAMAFTYGPVPYYRHMIAGMVYASEALKQELLKAYASPVPAEAYIRSINLRKAKMDAALTILRKDESLLIQFAGSLQ